MVLINVKPNMGNILKCRLYCYSGMGRPINQIVDYSQIQEEGVHRAMGVCVGGMREHTGKHQGWPGGRGREGQVWTLSFIVIYMEGSGEIA